MPKRPSRKVFLSLLTFALASLLVFSGCRRAASVSATATTSTDEDKVGIASAMDAIHRGTEVKNCRNALNQLNSYFVRHPERKPPTLSDGQRDLLQPRSGGLSARSHSRTARRPPFRPSSCSGAVGARRWNVRSFLSRSFRILGSTDA